MHEYAARRLSWLTSRIPGALGSATGGAIQGTTLELTLRFYSLAQVLFAPNAELCTLLADATAKPCALMQRGVDTEAFSPACRTRPAVPDTEIGTPENPFVLGFVGRLSIEKNVALLPRLARELADAGLHTRLLIVGHGAEEEWLRRELAGSGTGAEFAGVLRGTALAAAYANMDLLVFPSHTDTFGNVVLEALASGVPAVVTPDGGPKYIVREGHTGAIAQDDGFAAAITAILGDPGQLRAMRLAARRYVLSCSWDTVFDRVYAEYALAGLIPELAPVPGTA